jgi:1-acylglycerone phosphate reductase
MYGSTKAALTNASEAWRLELAPFGVRVVTVITGAVASNFFANVPDYTSPPGSLYGAVEQNIRDIEKQVGTFLPTEVYAEEVVAAVDGGHTGLLYRGNNSSLARFITAFAPTWVLDRVFSRGRGFEKLVAMNAGDDLVAKKSN